MSAVQHFSTRGLAIDRRVPLWEQHNARALVGLECRPLTSEPLDASEVNIDLPTLGFARVRATPHVVERSERLIHSSETDGVALYFALRGESFFYHRDGVHVLRPGTLLICDVNQPFMRGFAGGLDELVLRAPERVVQHFFEPGAGRRPRTIDFSAGAAGGSDAAALARLVGGALKAEHSSAAHAAADAAADAAAGSADSAGSAQQALAIESEALTLLRAILESGEQAGPAAVRRRALAVVQQRLGDPRLSVDDVARRIGVSQRQLSRVFAETGTGLARVILEQRLDRADRMLRDPTSHPLTIAAVASACGFTSHSHFTRVYRERFEVTPARTRSTPR